MKNLFDKKKDNVEGKNDIMSTVCCDKFNTSLRTKMQGVVSEYYEEFPPLLNIDDGLKIDYNLIIGKPFFIQNLLWQDTAVGNLGTIYFPSSLFGNAAIEAPFKFCAKYRLKIMVSLQVMGTPQHQGTILVAATPAYLTDAANRKNINSLMSCPHAFLHANEGTPVCLEVPFYSQSVLRNTDINRSCAGYSKHQDYAELVFHVLHALGAPATGSNEVTISVHCTIVSADFLVPNNAETSFIAQSMSNPITTILDSANTTLKTVSGDFFDNVRDKIRSLTGLHNPNSQKIDSRMLATSRNFHNNVDIPTFVEKLDPYSDFTRVIDRPIFYTKKDEMLIANMIAKPQFIGQFQVTVTTPVNTTLFSRPISPLQDPWTSTTSDVGITSIQGVLATLTSAWRGPIDIHIMSSMTNFHNVKLGVYKDYSMDGRYSTGAPSIYNISTYMSDTLEFTGGGQVQTVRLPFCGLVSQIPTHIDCPSNAMSHGVYMIKLIQPLIFSGVVGNTINFSVFISLPPEFTYYGYPIGNVNVVKTAPAPESMLLSKQVANVRRNVLFDSAKDYGFKAESSILNISDNTDVINDGSEGLKDVAVYNMRPVTHMRDFFRRYALCGVYAPKLTENSYKVLNIKINELLRVGNDGQQHFQRIARRFFYGFSGGYKFKVYGDAVKSFSVRYLPPRMYVIPEHSFGPTFEECNLIPSNPVDRASIFTPALYPDTRSLNSLNDLYAHNEVESSIQVGTNCQIVDSSAVQPAGKSVIECYVPYMSVLDFVGDSRNSGDVNADATGDLGYLSISYTQDMAITGVTPVPGNATFTIYCAYSDEHRAGFQVLTPKLHPVIGVTAGLVVPYVRSDGTLAPCLPSTIPYAFKGNFG